MTNVVEALGIGLVEFGGGILREWAVSAVSCFMFAMVERTIANVGAWIFGSTPSFLSFFFYVIMYCCYYHCTRLRLRYYEFVTLLLNLWIGLWLCAIPFWQRAYGWVVT